LWAKGYTELLVLLSDTNDIEIDCYGGGPELNDIQNKSRVLQTGLDFKGPADHADASIFGAYDVFVNPSISEVLCTATAEALAMGKRVVIAEHPSNEFFYQFETCYKVPPGDSEAFRQQLEKALDAAAEDRLRNKPWASSALPEALKPLTWSAATDRLVAASALDARAPPARLALASFVMHSYHWGMTASPLALDLWLTMSGAGPHTPWSDRRDKLIGVSSLKRGNESDSTFQENLRRNLATRSEALQNANRLSKVISERLRKRDGAAQVARHLGPTRRRRKLWEALPRFGVPAVEEQEDAEESLPEESLFFDAAEPSGPADNWPRTRRFWRRLRGRYELLSASWLEPRQFRKRRKRDRSLPKQIKRSAARATQSLRRELASDSTSTRSDSPRNFL
jgi:hypothetical protein